MKHYMGFLSRRQRERQTKAQQRRQCRLQAELAYERFVALSERQAAKLREQDTAMANRSWVQKLADWLFSLPRSMRQM